MKRRFVFFVILLAVTLPFLPNNVVFAEKVLAPAECRWKWAPIQAPSHPGPGFAHRVVVRNADDVWAAGTNLWHWTGSEWNVALNSKRGDFSDVVTFGKRRVYALRGEVMLWNSKKWKPLGILPPLEGGTLSALAIVSKNDVWVSLNLPDVSTQMLHWDGRRWKRVGEPIAGHVNDMEVVGANDIWAGGDNLYQWDGSTWQNIKSVSADEGGEIHRLQTGAAGALWAVGSRRYYDGHTTQSVPLALHWNGENWLKLEQEVDGDFFSGVMPRSENDVWLTSDSALWHWDGTTFTLVPSGPPSRASLDFGGIAFDETDRLWIVGSYYGGSAWAQYGNGATWQDNVLPEPRILAATQFQSATAPASDTVWIAGSNSTWVPGSYTQEFAMLARWNGAAWSFADLDHEPGHLDDISAASPSDIWAVGTSPYYGSLYFHYDGVAWQRVPGPTLSHTVLNAVVTLSENDAWAVGYIYRSDAPTPFNDVHIMHWDGTRWSVSPTPPIGGPQSMLYDVYALSPNDVWAVGDRLDEVSGVSTLVLHWDGNAWSIVPSPSPKHVNWLSGIASLAPGEIWASGSTSNLNDTNTLLLHWTDQGWESIVDNSMYRVTAIESLAPKSLWGIGMQVENAKPLVARWNGKRWRTFWAAETKVDLQGITVLSENEIWAVGRDGSGPLVVRGLCQEDR